MNLADRVVWITGGSSGIGQALAFHFLNAGCRVALTSRSESELLKFQDEMGKDRCLILPGDVTQSHDVERVMTTLIREWHRVDIAILSAGVCLPEPLEDSDETFRRTFAVNVFGFTLCAYAALSHMKARGHGTIVGISSVAGDFAWAGRTSYSASKAAVSCLLEGWRRDWEKSGIEVVTVKAGFVETPMTRNNRFYMPFRISADDAAVRILHGIQNHNQKITFPLPMVWLTKSMSLLPEAWFRTICRWLGALRFGMELS